MPADQGMVICEPIRRKAMAEELLPMTLIAGQKTVIYSNDVDVLTPRVAIAARDYELDQVIVVEMGTTEVARHRYREGDDFTVHVILDKSKLHNVVGTVDFGYKIVVIDDDQKERVVATSKTIRAEVHSFNSSTSSSFSNVLE
jgi:hypothetical protein